MTENEDPLFQQQTSQWTRELEKQTMDNTAAEPLSYKETLDLLRRAVNPVETDMTVITKTLHMDDKTVQELYDHIRELQVNDGPEYQTLPRKYVDLFFNFKLARPEPFPDDKAAGVYFDETLPVYTSRTMTLTTSKRLPYYRRIR